MSSMFERLVEQTEVGAAHLTPSFSELLHLRQEKLLESAFPDPANKQHREPDQQGTVNTLGVVVALRNRFLWAQY